MKSFIFLTSVAYSNPTSSNDVQNYLSKVLENSPYSKSIENEKEVAELRHSSSKAALAPKLTAEANAGPQGYDPNTGQKATYSSAQLTLTENLYDNGISWTNLKISREQKRLSTLIYTQKRDQLCFEALQVYLRFSLRSLLLGIQKGQLDLIRRQYNLTQQDYLQGLKTKKDFLRFKTQYQRASIDLSQAENNLEQSRLDLKEKLNLPASSAIEITAVPLQKVSFTGTESEMMALVDHGLLIQIAEGQRTLNDLQYTAFDKTSGLSVNLNLSAQYGSTYFVNTGSRFQDNDQFQWQALIGVKVPLLDWGKMSNDSRAERLNADIRNNSLMAGQIENQKKIRQLFGNLKQYQKQVDMNSELLDLEKNNIALLENDYKQGKVPYLDFITALNDKARAESSYYLSLYDMHSATYEWQYYQGLLYENIFKK